MANCGTIAMAKALNEYKIPVALHKFYEADVLRSLTDEFFLRNFYTLGIRDEDYNKLKLTGLNPQLICIDVANGYIKKFLDFVKKIRDEYPTSYILAGNVCTFEGSKAIIDAGANCAKVGIGNGAHCSTYNLTGVGLPQMDTVMGCSNKPYVEYGEERLPICSDGGVKEIGDINKYLVVGAELVMVGTMFCGYEENEGDWTFIQNWPQGYKKGRLQVYGMSSRVAQSNHYNKNKRTPEGVDTWIDYKGPVANLAKHIIDGIQSCGAYIGKRNVSEFNQGAIIAV